MLHLKLGVGGLLGWSPAGNLTNVILSANSSLILTNWPDLTLSTSLRGKGSSASERTKEALGFACGSCGRTGFTQGGLVVVATPEGAVG